MQQNAKKEMDTVKHIILSDHTADRLNHKEVQRQKQYEEALKKYNAECKNTDIAYEEALKAYDHAKRDWQQNINSIKTKQKTAWKRNAWWQAVRHTFQLFLALISDKPSVPNKTARPSEPIKKGVDEDDRIWQSGRAGEQQAQDLLLNRLNSDWRLFSGYKNRKGEVDKILVGPEGIFAIEIKNINGDIYCNGDRWWKDKYDNYGNLVEWDLPIQDRKGRSPSQQLNEPVDMLQEYLKRTFPLCQIYRIVVFTHEASTIKELTSPTVNEVVIIDDWNLNNTFERSIFKLSAAEIAKISKMIESDHKFMNNPSRRHFAKKEISKAV